MLSFLNRTFEPGIKSVKFRVVLSLHFLLHGLLISSLVGNQALHHGPYHVQLRAGQPASSVLDPNFVTRFGIFFSFSSRIVGVLFVVYPICTSFSYGCHHPEDSQFRTHGDMTYSAVSISESNFLLMTP